MKKIYKYKAEGYLKQGYNYKFKVIRKVKIPNDKKYFILEDYKGKRHLLLSEYYKNYNIKINAEIECHIDKINCVGNIFLEPLHHYYKKSFKYEFEYIREIEVTKKSLKMYKYHKFKGEFGFIALLPISNLKNKFDKNSKKTFEIEKISKAKIYLKG